MWGLSESDLYCVSTLILSRPELTKFESAKSMSRYRPAMGTAGLARSAVSGHRRRPSPPARTMARTRGAGPFRGTNRSAAILVSGEEDGDDAGAGEDQERAHDERDQLGAG